jgi:hypothetical protein
MANAKTVVELDEFRWFCLNTRILVWLTAPEAWRQSSQGHKAEMNRLRKSRPEGFRDCMNWDSQKYH